MDTPEKNQSFPRLMATTEQFRSTKASASTNGGDAKLPTNQISSDLRLENKAFVAVNSMDQKHLPSSRQVAALNNESANFHPSPDATAFHALSGGNESSGSDPPKTLVCFNCGKLGHKAADCRLARSHGASTRWHKRETLISQSRQHSLEEALGAADAKIEILKEKKETPPLPSIQVSSEVKAVDFDLTLPVHAFTVYSRPLGVFSSMLADMDGNHIEDSDGNCVQSAHMWQFVQKEIMDTKLDQRPVQYMGYETYKKDANLQIWSIERNRRFASFATMWRTGKTMSLHYDRVVVSMTMIMNMISRDGVATLLSATDEFIRSRYDIIATSVNIPQVAGLKENTILFLRDYCQYVCAQHHFLSFDDLPVFQERLLDVNDTGSPMGTDVGISNPWAGLSLLGLVSGLETSIEFIVSIFLVYLLGVMLRGPFCLVQTLMTNVRFKVASPSELVVRYLLLIMLLFVGFVVSFAGGFIATFGRSALTLMSVLLNGLITVATLTGELARYSRNLLAPVAYFVPYISNVKVLLSGSHIIVLVVLIRRLAPLILDQMHLRQLVVQYLQRLSARSINYHRLSNMCQWLIGLDT